MHCYRPYRNVVLPNELIGLRWIISYELIKKKIDHLQHLKHLQLSLTHNLVPYWRVTLPGSNRCMLFPSGEVHIVKYCEPSLNKAVG